LPSDGKDQDDGKIMSLRTEHLARGFAEETLGLMPGFVVDAREIEKILREKLGHAGA
jgi:hypothetical protein